MNWSKYEILLKELGVREEIFPALQKYKTLLWKSNESLNLISRKMTEEEFMDNHVVDCFLPLSYFPKNTMKKKSTDEIQRISTVADFGAGGRYARRVVCSAIS